MEDSAWKQFDLSRFTNIFKKRTWFSPGQGVNELLCFSSPHIAEFLSCQLFSFWRGSSSHWCWWLQKWFQCFRLRDSAFSLSFETDIEWNRSKNGNCLYESRNFKSPSKKQNLSMSKMFSANCNADRHQTTGSLPTAPWATLNKYHGGHINWSHFSDINTPTRAAISNVFGSCFSTCILLWDSKRKQNNTGF